MVDPKLHIFVPYHPSRPVHCLHDTLVGIEQAWTGKPPVVEVFVQGAPRGPLPKSGDFPFQLLVTRSKKNLGNAEPAARSVERALQSGAHLWARVQDDVILDKGSFDLAAAVLRRESTDGSPVAACQVRTLTNKKSGYWMRAWCFTVQGGSIYLDPRSYATKKIPGCVYDVVECIGFGSTIYRREVFTAGCIPDKRYFLGGIDTDLAYQLVQRGFLSALTRTPTCVHRHQQCLGPGYQSLRYCSEHHNRSADVWAQKWGVEFPFLRSLKIADVTAPR